MNAKHRVLDRRRRALIAGAAATLLPLRTLAQESTYPERNITLYCPYAAGGPADIALRALAEAVNRVLPRGEEHARWRREAAAAEKAAVERLGLQAK